MNHMPASPKTLESPDVELSLSATSAELAVLSAAAKKKKLSLRDFLRLQIMAAAKAASKPDHTPSAIAQTAQPRLSNGLAPAGARAAFLP